MNAIIYLIPISIGLGACALIGFLWSIKARQYDNLESDAFRILTEDDYPHDPEKARHLRDDLN